MNLVFKINLGRPGVGTQPASVAPPTPQPRAAPSPSFSAPVATVDGGPATSFHLPVGTAARFTDQDGTWAVALLGVEWIDECANFLGDAVPVVAFDIDYEVTQGAVSVIPLTDFTFVLPSGTTARVGILSSCVEHPLDYTVISAGHRQRGRIAIEVPSGTDDAGGELTYGQLAVPAASWTVPPRGGG